MANSDKNIVITPNRGLSGLPEIAFTGVGNSTIQLQVGDSSTANLNFVSAGSTILSIDSNTSSGSLLNIQGLSNTTILDIPFTGDIAINGDVTVSGHGVVLPSYATTSGPAVREGLLYYDPKTKGVNVGTTTSVVVYANNTDVITSGMLLHLHPSSFYDANASNNIWPDIRGNSNHMIQQNGPVQTSANGGVIIMNRSNSQHFVVTDSIYWQDIRTVTFDLWFQTSAGSSRQGLISTHGAIGSSNNDAIEIEIQAAGNSFAGFRSTNGTFYQALWNTTLSLNTWYCISVVLDNFRIRYYANGSLVASSAWPQTLVANSSSGGLYLGRYESHYLGGAIGEFKMYHRPLQEWEVRQNFEATRGRFGI